MAQTPGTKLKEVEFFEIMVQRPKWRLDRIQDSGLLGM
jgi:hypothetical protein